MLRYFTASNPCHYNIINFPLFIAKLHTFVFPFLLNLINVPIIFAAYTKCLFNKQYYFFFMKIFNYINLLRARIMYRRIF